MNNTELIREAEKVLRPLKTNDRLHGDVAAIVLSNNGKIYKGVCVDTPSWGLCAERSALASMISDGEYKFNKVVAVWKDDKTNKLHVLPPCGHCRQFMRDISESNMDSEIILGTDKSAKLMQLLPFHEWPEALES